MSSAGSRGSFSWHGRNKAETATVYFSSGCDEQPPFPLTHSGQRGLLSAFGVEDLGEP